MYLWGGIVEEVVLCARCIERLECLNGGGYCILRSNEGTESLIPHELECHLQFQGLSVTFFPFSFFFLFYLFF